MQRIAFALALASSSLTPVAAIAQDTATTKSEEATAQDSAVAAPAKDATAQTGQTPPADESAAPADQPPPPTTSEVTLGAQWVGGKNTGLFGRYNGLTYKGLDLIGGFALRH